MPAFAFYYLKENPHNVLLPRAVMTAEWTDVAPGFGGAGTSGDISALDNA